MRRWLALTMLLCPVVLKGGTFLDRSTSGVPFHWPGGFSYYVDQGTLGTMDNASATTQVTNSFAAWSGVSVADITITSSGPFSVNVTDANVENYVTFDPISGIPSNITNDTVVIFDDTDGSILELFFPGSGSIGAILGVASPGQYDDDAGTILAGFGIISGVNMNAAKARAIMTHEFGHMLNLAHTQLNIKEFVTSDLSDDVYIPTMFPVITANPADFHTLHREDEFSLAYLYPNASLDSEGTLSGSVRRRKGEGIRGVNVICRRSGSSRADAVSWVSDQVFEGNGEYLCRHLPAGDYTVEIEPIYLAINTYDPFPPFIVGEHYNGADESFDPLVDAPADSTEVTVAAAQETADVDFVLNEEGRLVSGEAVKGTTTFDVSDLDYFITVPKGASKLTLEVETLDDGIDLDLAGRCDSEFSLTADVTSPPFVGDSGEDQQAEFKATTTKHSEKLSLDGGTDPILQACTYHIVVLNLDNYFGNMPADFRLTATISGIRPRFLVNLGEGAVRSEGSGETLTLHLLLKSEIDVHRLTSLQITDIGDGDLGQVKEARLYVDVDEDGALDPGDRLIASTTEIDRTSRSMTFSGFDELFEIDGKASYLVSYDIQASSSAQVLPWLAAFLAVGFLFGRNGRRKFFSLLFLMLALHSCGGETPHGYHPRVREEDAVGVRSESFGQNVDIRVQGARYDSVKEFFD